jgi:hypothetical protein
MLAAALLASGPSQAGPVITDEADLTWRYRLLLVANDDIQQRRETLEAAAAGVAERDLLWFVFDDDTTTTNASQVIAPELVHGLRNRLVESRGEVMLIGKDGGAKLAADELDLPSIFSRIDAMPMRRREMER